MKEIFTELYFVIKNKEGLSKEEYISANIKIISDFYNK